MKKKVIAALLTVVLTMSMSMTALADGANPTVSGGTDVYAGFIKDTKDKMLFVEVPTLIAFVVKTDNTTKTVISPNSEVVNGKLTAVNTGTMNIVNRSSQLDTAGTTRVGMAVSVLGTLKENDAKGDWVYDKDVTLDQSSKIWHYKLSVAGKEFMVPSGADYKMSSAISLAAPTNTTFDATTKRAINGTSVPATVVVTTGGTFSEYNALTENFRNSVKAATISWEVADATP